MAKTAKEIVDNIRATKVLNATSTVRQLDAKLRAQMREQLGRTM